MAVSNDAAGELFCADASPLRGSQECFGCLAQRPQAVAPGTQNIEAPQALRKLEEGRVGREYL